MALVKCGECGKEISDKAAACPGCGAPTAPVSAVSNTAPSVAVTRSGGKWEAVGTILIVAGVLSVMFASPPISTFGSLAFVVGLIVFVIGRFK
jgi:hypothetical protein